MLVETADGVAGAKASRGDRYRLAWRFSICRPALAKHGYGDEDGETMVNKSFWARRLDRIPFLLFSQREDFRMVDYQTIAELVNQISVDTWHVLREITQRRPAIMLSELIDCKTRASQEPERREPRSPTDEPINPG